MYVKFIVGKKRGDNAEVVTTIAECARVIRLDNSVTLEGVPDGEGVMDYDFKGAHRVRVFVMSDTGATVDHFILSPSG